MISIYVCMPHDMIVEMSWSVVIIFKIIFIVRPYFKY